MPNLLDAETIRIAAAAQRAAYGERWSTVDLFFENLLEQSNWSLIGPYNSSNGFYINGNAAVFAVRRGDTVVISIRGSATELDTVPPVTISQDWYSASAIPQSYYDRIAGFISSVLASCDTDTKIILTGHSLGAQAATIAAIQTVNSYVVSSNIQAANVSVILFGTPNIPSTIVNSAPVWLSNRLMSFVNSDDLIPVIVPTHQEVEPHIVAHLIDDNLIDEIGRFDNLVNTFAEHNQSAYYQLWTDISYFEFFNEWRAAYHGGSTGIYGLNSNVLSPNTAFNDNFVVEGLTGLFLGLFGNDTITLNASYGGTQFVSGGQGDDTLIGGGGTDYLDGGSGADHLSGGSGADFLAGGGDDDRLSGQGGDDRLIGGAGSDRLYGGGHRDTLRGDGGSDILDGGTEDDTALFEEPASAYHLFRFDGGWYVKHKATGDTDTLVDIEYLQFAGGPPTLRDQLTWQTSLPGMIFDFPLGEPDSNGRRPVPSGSLSDRDGYYTGLGIFEADGDNILSGDFGDRENPSDSDRDYHLGEDWNSDEALDDVGLEVYAAANGVVVYASDGGTGWLNVVIIRHETPDGSYGGFLTTMYGHLGALSVSVGQTVSRGQQIGSLGDYGPAGAAGDHLHFEIRTGDNPGALLVGAGYSTTSGPGGWLDPSDFIRSHWYADAPAPLDPTGVTTESSGDGGLVNVEIEGNQISPQLSTLANGNYVVVWLDGAVPAQRNDLDTWPDIKARLYSANGTPVSGELSVNTSLVGNQTPASVTALSSGGFAVAWTLKTGTALMPSSQVCFRIFNEAGNPTSPEMVVSAYGPGVQRTPQIIEIDGEIVISWVDGTSGSGSIAHRFNSDGSPLGSHFNLFEGTPFSLGAEIAPLVGGGFVAVCIKGVFDSALIFRIFREDGTALTGNVVVDEHLTQVFDPSVAPLPGGGFVIAWTGMASAKYQVFSASGAPVGALKQVSPGGNGEAAITADALPGGGFVLTWRDVSPNGASVIQSRTFDDAGDATGPITTLVQGDNSARNGSSPNFDTAVLADGRMVLTREDGFFDEQSSVAGADGSGAGIRTQFVTFSPAYTGTDGNDLISGSGGNDSVQGGGGDDDILGNAGADHLEGGAGQDRVDGGDGDDVIVGGNGAGDDVYIGGAGVDTLRYTSATGPIVVDLSVGIAFGNEIGADRISGFENVIGGSGDDDIRGDAGNNVIDGGAGNDNISAGAGDDLLDGGATGTDTLAGGAGNDTVSHRSSSSGVQIYLDSQVTWDGMTTDSLSSIENAIGSAHADYLGGDAGANRLDGGAGNDVLDGGAGDDVLIGGLTGLDHLRGGAGVDQITYAGHATGVQIYLDSQISWDGVTMDFLSSIENAVGTSHADFIGGDAAANRLEGAAGDDFLEGAAGDDVLIGGLTGLDHLRGGEGVDQITYAGHGSGVQIYLDTEVTWDGVTMDFLSSIENAIGSDHADYVAGNVSANRLDGGAGDDFLEGGAGDDLLIGGTTGLDHLRGGEGVDQITYAGHGSGVQIYLDTEVTWDGVTMDFLSSIENAIGSDHADYMAGNASANRLEGGAGDDFLDGGAGDDFLDGGVSGLDSLRGGAGTDTVSYASSATGVEIYLDNQISWDGTTVDLLSSIENVVGSARADYIAGDAGANQIEGGGGDDVVNGGAGTDVFTLRGLAADYTITAEAGVFRVTDAVTGRDGSDLLTGMETLRFSDGTTMALTPAAAPEVLPALAQDKDEGPQVLPGAHDDVSKHDGSSPEVLPGVDDSFVLTGKTDLPPVLPPMDEVEHSTEMEQAREAMMALARENWLSRFDDNLTLLDDASGIAAPSRGDVWQ